MAAPQHKVAGTNNWDKFAPGLPGQLSKEQEDVSAAPESDGISSGPARRVRAPPRHRSRARANPLPRPPPRARAQRPHRRRLQILGQFMKRAAPEDVDCMRFPCEPAEYLGCVRRRAAAAAPEWSRLGWAASRSARCVHTASCARPLPLHPPRPQLPVSPRAQVRRRGGAQAADRDGHVAAQPRGGGPRRQDALRPAGLPGGRDPGALPQDVPAAPRQDRPPHLHRGHRQRGRGHHVPAHGH